jgi:hypothetical protein
MYPGIRILAMALCASAARVRAQSPNLALHAEAAGAFAEGGGYANNGGLSGRIGVAIRAYHNLAVQLDAAGFLVPNSTLCVDAPGACPPDFPRVRAITADARLNSAAPGAAGRVGVLAGAGLAHISGARTTTENALQLDGGVELALARTRSTVVVLVARADWLPHTSRGALVIVPIGVGLRVW